MASNQAMVKGQNTGLAPVVANPMMALHQQYEEGRFNLLAPKIHVGRLPEGTALAIREVRVSPDDKGDVYPVDGGALALTKVALNKIASAAGITWVHEERVDDRLSPYVREYRVHGRVTDFDGTVRDIFGTKGIDLRDDNGEGKPGKDAAGMSPKQLGMARKFIDELCVSKARNRAIADILAIKRSYSKDELKKPFIVPKLVPDTSNPMAQQFVLAQMTGAIGALYPARQAGPVFDAKLEPANTDPALPPAPAEEEDAVTPAPAASSSDLAAPDMDPPDMNPTTGEVPSAPKTPPTADEVKRRTGAAYQRIVRAHPKFTAASWRSLVRSATGRDGYDGMTHDDLSKVDQAAEAYVANLEG